MGAGAAAGRGEAAAAAAERPSGAPRRAGGLCSNAMPGLGVGKSARPLASQAALHDIIDKRRMHLSRVF